MPSVKGPGAYKALNEDQIANTITSSQKAQLARETNTSVAAVAVQTAACDHRSLEDCKVGEVRKHLLPSP